MRSMRARPADIGHQRAIQLASWFGRELRIARASVGLTQVQLARLAHLSQTEVSRAERGEGDVSLDARCRLAAAAGHELGWRLYPSGAVSLRDSGQLHIAQAIVRAANKSWRPRLEAPVGDEDRRAADLILAGPTGLIHVEIERALVDLQAQLRSAQLKRQSIAEGTSLPVRLVIAVPGTRATRRRLAPFGDLIGRALPVTSRHVWRAIQSGEMPAGDGILFVSVPIHGPRGD